MTTISASSARRLSAAEFHEEVTALRPRIAVFDCDGTLWKADSGYEFMGWSIDHGVLSQKAADWIHSRYRLYRAGKIDEIPMCGEMVSVYEGLQESDVRTAAAQFFQAAIEPGFFPEMRNLVQQLVRSGTEIWAVSSTNNWVIEAGLHALQIPAERILGTRVRVTDGVITSEMLAIPSDEAKARALEQAGVNSPDAVFGNSIHDLAMLEIAKHAFPVNPTPELLRQSESRSWPIFYPAAVLPDPS